MHRYLLPLLVALMLLSGCEEDIVMPDPGDRLFTLYGVLNPTRDTQYVHVFPVEATLTPGADSLLGIDVTLTDLVTAQTVTLKDSLIHDAQGNPGHVFWYPGRVQHDRKYRLTASAPGGGTSEAEVLVPPAINPRVVPQTTVSTTETIDLGNLPRVLKPILTVEAWVELSCSPTGCVGERFTAKMPLQETTTYANGSWKTRADISAAYLAVYNVATGKYSPEIIRGKGIDLLTLQFEYIAANTEWNPPDGLFNPDYLQIPEAMTNVKNGLGFVGAGFRTKFYWNPDPEILKRAGFKTD